MSATVTPSLPASQSCRDSHGFTAGRNQLPPDQTCADTHDRCVGGSLDSDHAVRVTQQAAVAVDLPPDHWRCDTQARSVGGSLDGSDHAPTDSQIRAVAAVELQFAAAFLDDIERVRIATENRIRSFTQEGFPADPYLPQLQALQAVEHQATLNLQRAMRRHPLGAWVKRTIGIGEKQGARLIAALDDPAYNHAEDRPRRGPAELWAYCGFAPGQKRRKGVKSNWNANAKMRAFLIAESCIKQRTSPYRADYDRARANWESHDTSDGHKHNHALRVVAKAVLRDLFNEARTTV